MTAPARVNPFENIKPSPRVRLAARLYATGALPTKKAASAAAGLHPAYLTMLTSEKNGSTPVKRLLSEVDQMIENKTIQTSAIIDLLGRKAIGKIAALMESAGKEEIQLAAARDLADRSPTTQATQRLQVDSFSLGPQEAKEIALAMVESARERERYAHIAQHGLTEIQDGVQVQGTQEATTDETGSPGIISTPKGI